MEKVRIVSTQKGGTAKLVTPKFAKVLVQLGRYTYAATPQIEPAPPIEPVKREVTPSKKAAPFKKGPRRKVVEAAPKPDVKPKPSRYRRRDLKAEK